MNHTTRRGFIGLGSAFVAVTATGQAQQTSKLARHPEFKYLRDDIKELLLENEESIRTKKYAICKLDDAYYQISLMTWNGKEVISVVPMTFSKGNLIGQPSGFDYDKMPKMFGYQPDDKLMAKVPQEERETLIRPILEVMAEGLYGSQYHPFCPPDKDKFAKGEGGMLTREPTLTYSSNKKDVETILRKSGRTASDEKKKVYSVLSMPTSTEWFAEIGTGSGFPSACDSSLIGANGRCSVIFRGLAKYPSNGTPGLNEVEQTLMNNSKVFRANLVQRQVAVLQEVIDGKHSEFGTISADGKTILREAVKYYTKQAKDLAKLNLKSPELKPKGGTLQ